MPKSCKLLPFCRKLVGVTSDNSSESTLSNTTKAVDLDPAVLKSYVVIDCQLTISDVLPCAEQRSINHRPIEQPPLEEGSDHDSTSESNDSPTMLASPTERSVYT